MNRITLIVGGLILVIVVVILAFAFRGAFMRSGLPTPGGTTGTLPSVGTTGAGGGTGAPGAGGQPGTTGTLGGEAPGAGGQPAAVTFGVIGNGPFIDYFVDAKSVVTGIGPDGTITSIANAQATTLSSAKIDGIISASFSYDGKKALVSFGDQQNPQASVFDVAAKSWTPLPGGLISPRWSPTDYRIAYTKSDGLTETLATLDVSRVTNKPIALTTITAQELDPSWVNKNEIMLSDRPSVFVGGSAILFNLATKTFSQVASELPGFEAIWSSGASSTRQMGLIFSATATGRGGGLSLVDMAGNTLETLSPVTFPTKCTFNVETPPVPEATSAQATSTATSTKPRTAAKTPPPPPPVLVLYCAVPRDKDTLAVSRLPDDYNQRSLYTNDSLYKIDASSGSVSYLFGDPNQTLDATDIKIFGGKLFFINRYNGKLYGLVLTPQPQQ